MSVSGTKNGTASSEPSAALLFICFIILWGIIAAIVFGLFCGGLGSMLQGILVVLRAGKSTEIQPPTDRHCLNCGYDLRASPIRCPECGTKTPPLARRRFPLIYRSYVSTHRARPAP